LQAFERLEKSLPGQVVAIHGTLKGDEKEKAIAQFASGEKPVAVVSTVIEVGVDVPDVGCMVVNGADRFGVAQLHQLRGRLVRNGGRGDFVMMTEKVPSKFTRQRLEAVRDTPDGFALAEQDMLLRGFGDVLGDSQHGSTETVFKLARLKPEDFLG
jgi:ATP-dependent DNA helicase RecG